jgi:hypothetical protein
MQKILSQSQNKLQAFPLAEGIRAQPLGILPKDWPVTERAASSSCPSNVNKKNSAANSPSQARMLRYVRQSAAKRLLPNNRVSWCLRRTEKDQCVAVLKNRATGVAHYGGLLACARIWECPVCAAKIANRRREELVNATSQHRANGGGLLLVTYTFAHERTDDLNDQMKRLKKAWNAVKASREYKAIKAAHGLIGTVRALEITHGVNGWHPHFHEIWFLDASVKDHVATIAAIKTRLYEVWRYQCVRHGLGEPSETHGLDVRDGTHAAKYASKWGIEDELTKISSKKGRAGSRSPFQLLDSYIDGDKQAGALFAEYVLAFKNARQLSWSKGLKKLFAVIEKDDQQTADEEKSVSDVLGIFTMEQWAFILRYRGGGSFDLRSAFLQAAELDGWSGVLVFLDSLGFQSNQDKFPVRYV